MNDRCALLSQVLGIHWARTESRDSRQGYICNPKVIQSQEIMIDRLALGWVTLLVTNNWR